MENHINYAFIDSQQVHLTEKSLGWMIDWRKLRVYLKQEFNIENAYVLSEYSETDIVLYEECQKAGFICVFTHKNEIGKEDSASVKILKTMIHNHPYNAQFKQSHIINDPNASVHPKTTQNTKPQYSDISSILGNKLKDDWFF